MDNGTMESDGNKKGFSGIASLASNISGISEVPQSNDDKDYSDNENSKKSFALIELADFPSMPAPWSSIDSGETWIWGDFFFIFQKKPKNLLNHTLELQGKPPEKTALVYHYAMLVFYHLKKNPHGPSHVPIMAIALEQTDLSEASKIFGDSVLEGVTKDSGMGALMVGLFSGGARANLGAYEFDTRPETVKSYFFSVLRRQLGLSGDPHRIGSMIDAFGHPETGLEKEKDDKPKEPKQKPSPQPAARRPAQRTQSSARSSLPKKGASASTKIFFTIIVLVLVAIWIHNNEKDSKPYRGYSNTSTSNYSPPTTSNSQYTPIPSTTKMHVVAGALNVRAQPSGQGKKVGQLSKYDTITVLDDKKAGNWLAFNYEGSLAYAHSKYLKPGSGAVARNEDCRKSGVTRPRHGTILKAPKSGIHGLEVKNGSGPDALVKLKDTSGRTVFMAYVHGGATLIVNSIPAGSYQFQYATGRNYSPRCGIFLDDMQASKDPKFVKYDKTYGAGGYYTTVMQYTLYRVSGGNLRPQTISAEQF